MRYQTALHAVPVDGILSQNLYRSRNFVKLIILDGENKLRSTILNFGSCNIDHVYTVNEFVTPGETLSSQTYRTFPGEGKDSISQSQLFRQEDPAPMSVALERTENGSKPNSNPLALTLIFYSSRTSQPGTQ